MSSKEANLGFRLDLTGSGYSSENVNNLDDDQLVALATMLAAGEGEAKKQLHLAKSAAGFLRKKD